MMKKSPNRRTNQSIIISAILVLRFKRLVTISIRDRTINYKLIKQRKWLLNLYIYEFHNRFLANNFKVSHFLYMHQQQQQTCRINQSSCWSASACLEDAALNSSLKRALSLVMKTGDFGTVNFFYCTSPRLFLYFLIGVALKLLSALIFLISSSSCLMRSCSSSAFSSAFF